MLTPESLVLQRKSNAMSNQLKPKNSILFTEIYENQHEAVVGGLQVSFGSSDTYITSNTSNSYTGSLGNVNLSSSNRASYRLWQSNKFVTFDFGNYYQR